MRGRIGVAFALTAVALLASPAQAYVREVNDKTGMPLYWPTSCAAVTIYLNGFSMMTPDEVSKSIAAAAHAWSAEAVTCPGGAGDAGSGHPYFEIVPALSTGGAVAADAYDGKNSIIFETKTWSEDASFIAFTTHFSAPDGAILDTDIEINAAPGAPSTWGNLDPGVSLSSHLDDPPVDLQTAMTHEFGHFIGLKHTCFNPLVDTFRPDDDLGQPIPVCPDPPSTTPGDVPQAQSVMWFYVDPGIAATAKRVLAPDDVRGICAIYPPAQDPHSCALNLPDDGCGCASGGARGVGGAGVTLLVLGLFSSARRPRGRRRAPPTE
jgi:hypothetical protein